MKWLLSSDLPRQLCYEKKIGFKPIQDRNYLNLAWHVRKGDVTLHASDEKYYTRILARVLEGISMTWNDIGGKIRVRFVSEDDIPNVEKAIPYAEYQHGLTLLEDVCTLLTSDILITDGSSLAYVAAFGSYDRPLLIEERRKEMNIHMEEGKFVSGKMKGARQEHLFSENSAILLDDGFPRGSTEEMHYRLQAYVEKVW